MLMYQVVIVGFSCAFAYILITFAYFWTVLVTMISFRFSFLNLNFKKYAEYNVHGFL